jgi:hypothetical protein
MVYVRNFNHKARARAGFFIVIAIGFVCPVSNVIFPNEGGFFFEIVDL